jgi:amidohydrolase
MDVEKSLDELKSLIGKHQAEYETLARNIWETPELAFQEKNACRLQVELLSDLGFQVTSPYAGLETAYLAAVGEGGHTFCYVAEYDALPDLGHGCGHNLICAAAIAAGRATADLLRLHHLPGRVLVMGTPAEESGGGKVRMLAEDCLDGVDAVMMVHPSWRTTPDTGSTAIRRFDIEFFGKAAHAAGAPELGLNALDAVMLLFNGINAWRQQLPENARIHGIVRQGGYAPNIIPDHASCRFFLRSTCDDTLDRMEKRFRDIVKGAALMTGTTYEIRPHNVPYRSRRPNRKMNEIYLDAADRLGMNPVIPPRAGRGSSDFGDFSQVKPGIHPYFGIAHEEIAAHSTEFCNAAGSSHGNAQMLKAAAAMAQVGYRFLTDAAVRQGVLDAAGPEKN